MREYFGGKRILLGVTGSIAAYKACELASRFVEHGATVHAILTPAAANFVGAASLQGITGQRVITGLFDEIGSPEIEHIALAQRADLFLVAPATANLLAKAAHGLADDWLSTALLATTAPVLFAPALNTQMWQHPATQANVATLRARGVRLVGPEAGMLACRTVGPGRLADTPAILEAAVYALATQQDLRDKHVLISSGANHEPIDPVRFVGNRSTGRMGRALALEALRRGAHVTVVSGPHEIPLPCAAEVVRADTGQAMHDAVAERFDHCDIFIAAAAVADYRVDDPAATKHKRNGAALTLRLSANPDIAAAMGARKQPHQRIVGFAAETNDLVANARDKLARKRLDLIVANPVGGAACAIGADEGDVHLIAADGRDEALYAASKIAVAMRVFDTLATFSNDPARV